MRPLPPSCCPMSTLQEEELMTTNKTVPIGPVTSLTVVFKTNLQLILILLMTPTQDMIKPKTYIQKCMQIKEMKKLPGLVTHLRSLLMRDQICSHPNLQLPSLAPTLNSTERSSISTLDLSILSTTDVSTLKCILSISQRTPSIILDTLP